MLRAYVEYPDGDKLYLQDDGITLNGYTHKPYLFHDFSAALKAVKRAWPGDHGVYGEISEPDGTVIRVGAEPHIEVEV